jgi:hypothetical protein
MSKQRRNYAAREKRVFECKTVWLSGRNQRSSARR